MEALEQLTTHLAASEVPLAPILFAVFVLTTLACLPASTQALFSGALFGFAPALVLIVAGAVTGAGVARTLGRGWAGRRVRAWIDRQPVVPPRRR